MTNLPDPHEPLILADGTKIDPTTGQVIKDRPNFIEVPSNTEAQRQIARTRRQLADLPLPPKQMNVISLVVMYHLFGLADFDIALALNITEDQVGRIKMLDAFTEMLDKVSHSIIEGESDDIRNFFVAHSRSMAQRMVDLAHSDDGKVAVVAARDLLDRAGHRPADVIEHRHKMEGDLTINIVKKDKTQQVPELDLQAVELLDGDS